ncbi:MAG: 5'/3'-nucleotidase SurE [Bdellovibrionota bacterium]
MHILLTNDDGYQAKGIQSLYSHLKSLGHKVTMVAPKSERSAQSHAMTFYQPVQVEQISHDIYAVSGTPADCVAIGISRVLKDNCPDIIVSGINHGFNVGVDVNYSGTVGAATEAALMGHKALAVSMDNVTPSVELLEENFKNTAKLVGKILANIQNMDWPKQQVLNVNVPLNYKSIAVAQCGGESLYVPHIEEFSSQPRKELKVYLIGGIARYEPKDLSQDVSLVESGYATLSFIAARQSSTESNKNLEKILGFISNG